jgi:hypothetical protein
MLDVICAMSNTRTFLVGEQLPPWIALTQS